MGRRKEDYHCNQCGRRLPNGKYTLCDDCHSDLIKDVMYAYDDYYELVVNVSGSFNDFSDKNEDLNDELVSALNALSYEI